MNPFTWQDEGERKLASLIQLATLGSPFILPPSSPLCPLSSFTFTLHPAGVGLVASDGWRASDAVYRIGLGGVRSVTCLQGGERSLVQYGLLVSN